MYKKVPCGPTSYFDVDDTLIMWEIPENFPEEELVQMECRDHAFPVAPNKHNVNLLKQFAKKGHAIIVWSAGGSDWAESAVKGLGLEDYVDVVMGKPNYYVDDKKVEDWIGKYTYIDINGRRAGDYATDHGS